MNRNRKPARISAGLALVASLSPSLVGAGCGRSDDGLPRQAVSGQVTLDGQPIAQGMITFEPIDGSEHAASAIIQDGAYQIDRADGPLPGTHRVTVWSRRPTGRTYPHPDDPERTVAQTVEAVPARYNLQSELSAEVVEDGSNAFAFALTGGAHVAWLGSGGR